MEIMNNDFWKKRDAAMKRFMAAKERKRQRMAELKHYSAKTTLSVRARIPNL